MSLSNTSYPTFSIVAIPTVLKQLSINVDPRYLMNGEKLGVPLRKALVERLYRMHEDTLVINMDGIEEITSSVAEEIGPKLFQEFIKYREQNREVFLTYCNITGEIAKGLNDSFIGREAGSIVVFSNYHDGV